MSRLECRYLRCKQGLIDRITAIQKQKNQIRHGAKIPKQNQLLNLSLEESTHLLNYHSPKKGRVGGSTTKDSSKSTYFSRRPAKNVAFVCICGISFASTQNYGQVDHDDDHQEDEGEGDDEEDEDDADEATPSCNTNSATRSFGSEFAKAIEMTRCLQ
ncbi:hypothetical protein BGZ67_005514 [Mortierella alpina]|nr:hypothetical protein BGZ67_005514 [Mortierella alpina]